MKTGSSVAGAEPRSNAEWRLLGKLDVGVSHDYASGLAEWAILKSHLQQYGLQNWETCCEIGCGAGRITNSAAADFRVVHALDVSEVRIEQARAAPNVANCIFHLVSEPAIPLPNESCDLVYSIHVFQHFSSDEVVKTYFREIQRVLKPGGILMVHLPMVGAHGITGELSETVARKLGSLLRSISVAATRSLMAIGAAGALETIGKMLKKAGVREYSGGASIYRVFSFENVATELRRNEFECVELRILSVRDFNSYVFARRMLSKDLARTAE